MDKLNMAFNIHHQARDMDYFDYVENEGDDIGTIENGLSALEKAAKDNNDLKVLLDALEMIFDYVH